MMFEMPKLDGDKSIEGNYKQLLLALGLLSKNGSEADVGGAETELRRLMPRFMIDGETIAVESGKLKTAAYMFAVHQSKGQTGFTLWGDDRSAFFDYMTKEVVWDALHHPGKHKIIDRVLAGRVEVEVICPSREENPRLMAG